jgi:hypothetical protein
MSPDGWQSGPRSFNAKLEACGKKWLDNHQSILWSIRTKATKPTGETPFFLVYGAEAVLPMDDKFGSPRVLAFNEIHQEDLIKDRLLHLEEARCLAALRAARYQQGLRRYHSRYVQARTLEVGNLVPRRILSREGLHKLSPMWEGPFKGDAHRQAGLGAAGNRRRHTSGEPVEHSSSVKVLPVGSSQRDKTVVTTLGISSNCSSALILS